MADFDPANATIKEVALSFGMSLRMAQVLRQDGVLVDSESKKNRYDLLASSLNYVEHLKEKLEKSSAITSDERAKKMRVDRMISEQKYAERKNQLIDRAMAEAALGKLASECAKHQDRLLADIKQARLGPKVYRLAESCVRKCRSRCAAVRITRLDLVSADDDHDDDE